jgi:hypothetical protein
MTMVIKTVAIYVFFDDILKSMHHKEEKNRKITDAEVITVSLIAAKYFGGNTETAIIFVRDCGLIPNMLSKSRFNRRLHDITDLLTGLFLYTGEAVKPLNISSTYCIDGFPVSVCRNIRIPRCRILRGNKYRGYCASKREYFFGFKVHITVTSEGIPVECCCTAGNAHDPDGMTRLPRNLPEGGKLIGDSAYTGYLLEDMLRDNGIDLPAARKTSSKRQHNPSTEYLVAGRRKRIETAFSDMAKLMPESIHAVTVKGLLIKIIAFIWRILLTVYANNIAT